MKGLTVFVSSTFEDLVEPRRRVFDAILSLDCRPSGMESWEAADRSSWEIIKQKIDDADLCVTLTAGHYGSVDETGISYTEKEYNYALDHGKPILSFLHEDIDSLPGNNLKHDSEKKLKLKNFRDLCKKKQCSFWSTEAELESKVTRSLAKFIQENFGEVRGRNNGFMSDGIQDRRDSNIREEVRVVGTDSSILFYARKLNIPRSGVQTLLSWSEFGFGIELLMQQILSTKSRFAVDMVIGLNEAGLSIGAFLSGALMHRCPIGFLRVDSAKTVRDEWMPSINPGASVLIVDVEVKSGATLKNAVSIIRNTVKPSRLYFACLGAQANAEEFKGEITVDHLECSDVLETSKFDGFFAAFIGPPPSLEPPLYLE